ncbi:MAG: hypothetical protein HY718_04570 [Planctomycetes bacterium]|nr:hypothetical protein [Planctomycetota bacterium]
MGDSPLTIEGSLALAGTGPAISVRVASDSLDLGPAVRAALPDTLQAAFDSLAPAGRVRLDLNYEQPTRPTAATQPAPPGLRGAEVKYTALVEPMGCRLRLARLPLELEDVGGKVVLTPDGISIERLTARHGPTSIQMAGRITTHDDRVDVRISRLEAHDLRFEEELRQAGPWRLRRMWNDFQPAGACDLVLKDLVLTSGPNARRTWRTRGSLHLNQAAFSAGPRFTDVTGTFEGEAGYDDTFQVDARLDLKQARVDGRLLTDATARLHRAAGASTLLIGDILGTLYNGAVLGQVEVDYVTAPASYGLNLTARNVSLEEFLNARRQPDETPVRLKGRIQGTLSLTGQFDRPASRQGSGSILVQEAQMLKVPMVLAILQIIHFAVDDDNAFHDALVDYMIDGDEVILDRIDLRGKALSMAGAGHVQVPGLGMHLVLLVGSPLKLPEVAVLSELVEGVARELMEVHVEGTLDQPVFRADIVRSVRRTLEAMTSVRVERVTPGKPNRKE